MKDASWTPDDHDGPVNLTPGEVEALSGLPRERDPGRLLEERIVRSLREAGLLRRRDSDRIASASGHGVTQRSRAWWRGVAAVAAAVALFAGGVSVGQTLGTRHTADAFHTVFEDREARLAAQVQRTGSDYVSALSALAEAERATAADSSQALEVALTALWAAAYQIVRLAPDDPLAARILQGFEARAHRADGYGAGSQLLVEF